MDGDALNPDAIPEERDGRIGKLAVIVDQCVKVGERAAATGVLDRNRGRIDPVTPIDMAGGPLAEPNDELAGRALGDRLTELAVFECGRALPAVLSEVRGLFERGARWCPCDLTP